MKKLLYLTLTLCGYLSVGPTAAMENATQENVIKAPITSITGQSSSFLCERICGQYYTTSITGHATSDISISKFLEYKFQESWLLNKVEFIHESLPSPTDASYKYYNACLKWSLDGYKSGGLISPNVSENDLELIEHRSTCRYLYKVQSEKITVIFLLTEADIEFALKSCQCHRTLKILRSEESRLTQIRNDLDAQIFAARNIASQVFEEKSRLIRSSEYNEGTKLQIEKLNSTDSSTEREIQRLEKELKEVANNLQTINSEINNHIARKDWSSLVDFSPEWVNANNLERIIKHILLAFPGKLIQIHTLVSSSSDVNSSYFNRFLYMTSDSSSPTIGHSCYGNITINPHRSTIDVRVIDPTVDAEKPYLKPLFGSAIPSQQQSHNVFTKLAASLGLFLNHSYEYRWDQVFNFWDCSRFSMVYLLAELEGQPAMKLSNRDIYRGFKTLEAHGYDLFDQLINPKKVVDTWFSWLVGGPRRFLCDFVMRNVYADPSISAQIPQF